MHQIKSCIVLILFYFFGYNVYGQDKVVRKNVPDSLLVRIDSLKAAVVTARMRPKMKGDTLEYNTEHIVLKKNAAVEELLRRLPGLHIDPSGVITYNGQKIQHLLVDGEDIFGNDPSVVTRSFDASKIARVQILDRRSDQAIFTGIDDGARTKTLNLVLKENAKEGYFGKVGAGGNSDGYFNTNAALAAFRRKEQFTAVGFAANNGELGLTNSKSGATPSFVNVTADALGASAGAGIPHFGAAALHYANNWAEPVMHLAANYQFSHYYSQPVTATQTVQIQPQSIYGQQQISRSTNQQDQHWLSGIYEWAVNAVSVFKLTFHYSNSDGVNQFGATGNASFNDTVVNASIRTIRDRVNRKNIGGDLSWRIKVGKRTGRILSVNAFTVKIDAMTNGYIYTLNSFYHPNGLVQSTDTVDQRKQISSNSLGLGGSFGYTEPLWRGAILGLAYTISDITDDPLQTTFNRGDGKYQEVVDTLSNHFRTHNLSQRASLNLQGEAGPLSYTIGCDWLGYRSLLEDLSTSVSPLHRYYLDWTPKAILNYTPNKTTNVSFSYTSSTTQPLPAQVLPIMNNNDPLHITLGNPNLKPGLRQNLRLFFQHLKTWLLYLSLDIGSTSNSISTKTITDSLGRQISQSVNVDGGRSGEISLSLSRKLLGFDAAFHTNVTYAHTLDYINTALNLNDAYMTSGGLNIGKYLDDRFSLQLSTNFSYFDQVSSVNADAPIRYWSQTHSGGVSLFLIKEFEINTNFSYTWQQKSSAFTTGNSAFLWNAYVSRNLFRSKLVGKFQFSNILNANAGISRSNTGNINTQSSTNILGRYWMLSLTYIFDKKFRGK